MWRSAQFCKALFRDTEAMWGSWAPDEALPFEPEIDTGFKVYKSSNLVSIRGEEAWTKEQRNFHSIQNPKVKFTPNLNGD